jgi:hypothetical protein
MQLHQRGHECTHQSPGKMKAMHCVWEKCSDAGSETVVSNPRPGSSGPKLAYCRLWGVISAGSGRDPARARTIMGVVSPLTGGYGPWHDTADRIRAAKTTRVPIFLLLWYQ